MPWSQTSPMDQRTQFIADYLRDALRSASCASCTASRARPATSGSIATCEHGPAGLEDRSRRPHSRPNATPEQIVQAILELRRRHPTLGREEAADGAAQAPSALGAAASLHRVRHPQPPRHGAEEAQAPRIGHPGKPTSSILAPNDLWSADFKGQFKTGDGRYCYPLTVTDGFSRFLLGCQALHSTAVARGQAGVHAPVQRVRTAQAHPHRQRRALCHQHAWRACRSCRPGGCASGVLPEFIEPGKPQQNGRHERMHRTLKAETTRPAGGAAACAAAQFNRLPRRSSTHERPHEALDMQTPGVAL